MFFLERDDDSQVTPFLKLEHCEAGMPVLNVAACGGFVGEQFGRRFESGAGLGRLAAVMDPVVDFNLMGFHRKTVGCFFTILNQFSVTR